MTRRRGRALIINNKEVKPHPDRQGSGVDVENLEYLLESFQFDVVTKTNLSAQVLTHCVL